MLSLISAQDCVRVQILSFFPILKSFFFPVNGKAKLFKNLAFIKTTIFNPPSHFPPLSLPLLPLSFHWPNCLFGVQFCWKCNQTVSSFVTGMDFSEMGVESNGTCPEEKQMCSCFSGCFSCICCLGLELWLSGVSSELQSQRPCNPFR